MTAAGAIALMAFAVTILAPPSVPSPPAVLSAEIAAAPKAIAALGLEAVWALQSTGAGLADPHAVFNTPVRHAQGCNGCRLDANGVDFYITGANNLKNWDFSNFEVLLDGDITVHCTNCRFKARPDKGFALGAGQSAGGNPNWKCVHCYVDATAYDVPAGEGPIKWTGSGDEEWDYTYWSDSSRDHIQHSGTGSLIISWNYFGAVCIGTPGRGHGGAHCENIHIYAPTYIDHTFFDYRHTARRETAPITSFVFPQANLGPITVKIDSSIFAGTSEPSTVPKCHDLDAAATADASRHCSDYSGGLPWMIQTAAGKGGDISFTLTNSALSRGKAGFVASSDGDGHRTAISASGNYNLDSGAPLGARLP